MVIMAVLHWGLLVLFQVILLGTAIKASKPLCPNKCGDVVIPYPFGIGEGCYFDKRYEVVCENSWGSHEILLKSINRKVYSPFGFGTSTVTVNISVIPLNVNELTSNVKGVNLTGTPFSFSQRDNRVTATGCTNFTILNQPKNSSGMCLSVCTCDPRQSGDLCCDLSCNMHPTNASYNYSPSFLQSNCSSFTMVEHDWLSEKYQDNSFSLRDQKQVPVTLEWGEVKGSCFEEYDSHNKMCNKDNQCFVQVGSSGHLCLCDEKSSNASKYLCAGYLICNTSSGVDCSKCPEGYHQSGSTFYREPQCTSNNSLSFGKKSRDKFIVTGCTTGGLGMLFLLTGAWWLNKFVKKRREIKLKHKFFKRNGGLLLQKELSSYKGNIEKTKLFTSKELEKATDNFNKNRILGQGGQGTVYKGMLANGKIVAIKKSKIIDKSKVEESINEMVLLSQINHRKIVKLLGCCLETEVPLLVYEFISNGTLSQYIHDQNEEFPITWEMRLRIAVDISDAVSYLHSATSTPIYHRDIKSTNILLDDKYRAKISDFGTSRSVTVDQTHMTTQVQGTFGYLDPEYFQSSHFTDKSDVYSFGVVLAELLTGEKPIRLSNSEEDESLVAYFLHAMKEKRLFEILDDHVLKEGDKDEIIHVAKLAKRCLNLNGKKRPTMREVTMQLTRIRACHGASNVVRENVEEIDCADDDIDESSNLDACCTESSSSSVTISMM